MAGGQLIASRSQLHVLTLRKTETTHPELTFVKLLLEKWAVYVITSFHLDCAILAAGLGCVSRELQLAVERSASQKGKWTVLYSEITVPL